MRINSVHVVPELEDRTMVSGLIYTKVKSGQSHVNTPGLHELSVEQIVQRLEKAPDFFKERQHQ